MSVHSERVLKLSKMKASGLAWIYLTVAGICRLVGGQDSNCPAEAVPECYCTSSFNRYYYIRCEDYAADDTPRFDASNRTFTSLTFMRSSVSALEQDAFANVKLQALHLDSLGIRDVASGAFFGLGPSLQVLNLDSNDIGVIAGGSYSFIHVVVVLPVG